MYALKIYPASCIIPASANKILYCHITSTEQNRCTAIIIICHDVLKYVYIT